MSDSEPQKTTEQIVNEKVYPAIILGLSIVSFILHFATDFGGWYIYGPEIYRYVWMFSEMVWWSFFWMLPLAGLFAATAFLTLITLINPNSKWANRFNLIFLISIGSVGFTILVALIFILTVLDTTNWWLDTVFYAGLIGGGLNALFSYLVLRGKGEKIKFSLKG